MSENRSAPLMSAPKVATDVQRCHPEEHDPIQKESPLLSVLNVVVDHEMIAPTPLEPLEFRRRQQELHDSVQVPVLRVFGSVLRRDSGYCIEPKQSACLYIHGAYPYLLARPRLAGPDGSLHHNSHGQLSGHTDWDCVESVERILPQLQSNLEAAIQSSMQVTNDENEDKKSKTPQVIRRITVVTGRGFYTYCPGPPAPFLRVEYYNPKLRWKVKLILEQGLDVPRSYHPDPIQYQATLTPPLMQDDQVDMTEALSFHCYEAHIPYTMQFFKDWNLAGMAYIHLSGAKFRHALPRTCKRRTEKSIDIPEEALFLESNTPEEHVWNERNSVLSSMNSDIAFMQQSSAEDESVGGAQSQQQNQTSQTTEMDPFWTRKETSCDIEMDATVEQILNVKSVMTSLPEDEEERQKIHWRAVPSLREIWRKERQRMNKLLPPKDDFLSHANDASQVPFTLNAKESSTPGARLAAEGMHRLFRPSPGLEEQFRRAMKQIVERHSKSVSRIDDTLREQSEKASFLPLSHTPPDSSQLTSVSDSQLMDDAVDALDALACQFSEEKDQEESQIDNQVVDHLGSLSSQVSRPDGERDETNDTCEDPVGHPSSTQQPLETQFSQSSSSTSPYHLLSQQCTQDPFDFCQRVERGDCTANDASAHVEELIDPCTLTPYEDPEDLSDEDGFLEEEEAMTEREFERTLTILATQTQTFGGGKDVVFEQGGSPEGNSSQNWIHESLTQPLCNNVRHDDSNSSEAESEKLNLRAEDESTLDQRYNVHEPQEAQRNSSSLGRSSSLNDIPSIQRSILPIERGMLLAYNGGAPTRREVMGKCNDDGSGLSSARLYPLCMDSGCGAPKWLSLSTEYSGIRRELVSQGNLVHNWRLPTDYSAVEVEPICKAPSRGKVKSWSRKKRQLIESHTGDARPTKPRKRSQVEQQSVATQSIAWANDDLQTNVDKSHKLTAMRQSSGRSAANQCTGTFTNATGLAPEIEEVEWESSQRILLSMTPPESAPFVTDCGPKKPSSLQPSDTEAFRCDDTPHHESGQSPSDSTPHSFSQNTPNALEGIGQQGGRIHIEGGGGLKAKAGSPKRFIATTRNEKESSNFYGSDLPSPLTIMSIEIHVQCRVGRAGVNDSKEIAMRANPEKDRIFAIMYVYACDPGGGEALEILERGCLFVPNEAESNNESIQDLGERMAASMPRTTMGKSSKLTVQTARDEKHLLLRLASIVHWKDPDMLLSWDTQGSGIGFIIERGLVISEGQSERDSIDMVRLLGRTPRARKSNEELKKEILNQQGTETNVSFTNGNMGGPTNASSTEKNWKGSGLGTDWDERVGAGAAAASIQGRLVFAGWKIATEDVKHPNASYLPAIVSTVLSKRIPFHDDLQLTRWYGYNAGRERWRVLHYRLTQATSCLLILDTLDVCGRAVEAAGLSGVEFSQSFPGIRGSQYKVEGVLLRALQSINAEERGVKRGRQKTILSDDSRKLGIDHSGSLSSESKSQTQSPWKVRRRSTSHDQNEAVDSSLPGGNFFFFSPSLQDCNRQEALECQALTLEPQSGHYDDPVVVCDFTALYPSLMIAYNLCYTTCAGKLDYHSTRQEMRQEGRTTGKVGPMRYAEGRTATVLKHHMKSLTHDENARDIRKDRAYAAPTGTIFVSEAALRGVLPQVLDEMLTTRAMLKKAAKHYKKLVPDLASSVLRQLEARQLGTPTQFDIDYAIKMISNVTYGYTSATFSGRSAMPLVADAIVECGRRTLSNAISLANSWGSNKNGRWHGAEAIYGDTDSLFIRMRGRSVQEAFEFGEAFCKAVTASNPAPVHLKLEKVYKGSIMQTKKKYCGMKYESPQQKKPTFEAKGIETIRRDQCALTQKVLRNALVTLFQSGIYAVKSYLFRQWNLILSGRISPSDFILTGRVRSRYRGGRVGPVQAVLARRLAEADPGRVVRHKERLAYVIVATPGMTFKLRDCVLTPTELLEQWDAFSIHTTYYITKHVNAALQRCLGLSPYNVNVSAWFASCPKPRRRIHFWPVTRNGSNVMISSFFGSDTCSLCGAKCRANGSSRAVVCSVCQQDEIKAVTVALNRLKDTQNDAQECARVCSACNLCFEDSNTFAPLKSGTAGAMNAAISAVGKNSPGIMNPIANCTCIDCPNFFERHRLREGELEAVAICQALNLV